MSLRLAALAAAVDNDPVVARTVAQAIRFTVQHLQRASQPLPDGLVAFGLDCLTVADRLTETQSRAMRLVSCDDDNKPRQAVGALTVSEVARILRCSRATVFRKIASGEGPRSAVIGGRRLFPVGALLEWLEDQAA